MCLKEGNISMVVTRYASDITEYGRRTSGLSNAPLHMKQNDKSIEKKTDQPFHLKYKIDLPADAGALASMRR